MTRLIPLLLPLLFLTACSDDPPPAPPTEKPPDTTSHEISWSVVKIGDAETSLQKLFVVNDTSVYVVGEIRFRDSTGNLERDPYNAARWDGRTWTPLRIPVILCGTGVTDPMGLTTGFGFSDDRAHFFSGGNIAARTDTGYRYDCNLQFKLRASIQNVFAYAENDYYIVAGNSAIVHWDGQEFTREETGTQWETRDIFGNESDLWVVAGTPSNYKGGVLYKSRSGNWSVVDSLSDGGKRSVNSVWCDNRPYTDGGFVVLAGRGIWYRDTTWKRPPRIVTSGGKPGLGDVYFEAVRGRDRNDVFAVGDYGLIAHYNGQTWVWYPEINYQNGGILTSIAVLRNDVLICGVHADGKGRIIHGRRK